MDITAAQVKALRDKTGAGMMECKSALQEAQGDIDKAVDILRKKGLASAAKRSGRATANGVVGSYIHMGGKVGVLVEVNCETDFVARTDDFQALVKELALHIAAADPRYVRREDVPAELLDKEREIYRAQFADSGKPANVVDKIVEGKLGVVLLAGRAGRSAERARPERDRRADDRAGVRQDRREHHRRPVRPLQGRRQRLTGLDGGWRMENTSPPSAIHEGRLPRRQPARRSPARPCLRSSPGRP
jgi:hypothetical protein